MGLAQGLSGRQRHILGQENGLCLIVTLAVEGPKDAVHFLEKDRREREKSNNGRAQHARLPYLGLLARFARLCAYAPEVHQLQHGRHVHCQAVNVKLGAIFQHCHNRQCGRAA